MAEITRAKNEWNDITRSFRRVFNVPLDYSTIFDTYQDAEDYAKGDGSDSKKLGKTAYLGQIISVVNTGDSTVKVYKIVFGTGGQNAPYGLEQIATGDDGSAGGGGSTEEAFVFRTKNGNITVPAGSDLTEVVSILKQISDLKSDGVTTSAVSTREGDTVVNSNVDFTTALNSVTRYVLEHSSDGKISEDIDYDGETIVRSGSTIAEAFQAVVDQIFQTGGVNEITVNGEQVYDPSTNNAAFNIEGADADINIEFDEDAETPTFYVELSGISNGTIVLEGEEVSFVISIYNYADSTELVDTLSETTFVTGQTKTKKIYLGDTEEYTYYDQNREELIPDENGNFSFTITPSTSEIIVLRAETPSE